MIMPKVMTIGSLKNTLPAGAYEGPIGQILEGSPPGLRGLSGAGLGYACQEFGYATRHRMAWKCPKGKGKTRRDKKRDCKKVRTKTTELVCLKYDARLDKPGVTDKHKRLTVCEAPKRKLKSPKRGSRRGKR